LEIWKELFGEDHTKTAFGFLNLGFVYLEQKRFEEAEELLLQAYEIRKREYSENHQNTLETKTLLDRCRKKKN
jgi:tetratricopeptide (TPR) repeat protein